MNDVELLDEMNKQHQSFAKNTGPHYALVRKVDAPAIRQKLADKTLDIDVLAFADFGEPLLNAVKALAKCRMQQSIQRSSPGKPGSPVKTTKATKAKPQDNMALLMASPLDKPQDYSSLNSALKKFKCQLQQKPLTTASLQACDKYPYLLIVTRLTQQGLLIEDDEACSSYLALKDLETYLPIMPKAVIILSDRLPDPAQMSQVTLPLLILPALDEGLMSTKQKGNLFNPLFKKQQPTFFDKQSIKHALSNEATFNLADLKPGEHKINRKTSKLPQAIDKASLSGFTGRESDLVAISRQLLKLEDRA